MRIRIFQFVLTFATLAGFVPEGCGMELLARWRMDEAAAPYGDASGNGMALELDPRTTAAQSVAGIDGAAAFLDFHVNPGISTRLSCYETSLQRDSFGYSFWMRPVNLSPGESLLGKEMLVTSAGPAFSRLAWQVQVGNDDGTGSAPLVFLVRGTVRTGVDFYGSAVSTIKVRLHENSDQWVHAAGGYDATTGNLKLHVNGVETSVNGLPGAHSSDGGAVVVGSMVNGSNFIGYAASAEMDDVQIYDAPLRAADASELLANPSLTVGTDDASPFTGSLVAHWKLDEAGPWFGDWSGHENNLETDGVTTAPQKIAGVDGQGLVLNWQADPGVSTRMYAPGAAFQTDGFGFSFWIRPTRLSPGDNFIAKEMPPDGGENFTRMAWQVQVGADNGSGEAPLELVVRGGDRTQGDYFGSVKSAVALPLFTAVDRWVHVAGGYDVSTGALRLFVDGVKSVSAGTPGARSSDGSWFDVGTVRNGVDFTTYGAATGIDDIQLYSAPLSAYEVIYLKIHPGMPFTEDKHFKTSFFQGSSQGTAVVSFSSIPGWRYVVEGSADLARYVPLAEVEAVGNPTTLNLTKTMLDAAMGTTPRPKLFVRVRALLENADGSIDLPPADILPFLNPAPYVPQFHFSWENAAVGDPNGVLRYNNRYHFFTWDHATSDDLVSWQGLGWPMRDDLPDSGYWTGCVVMDKNNTSGFGSLADPPMVAIYTIHNNQTLKETIGISHSTNFHDFHQYTGNPVITTDDTVFRDPDVFWDDQTNRWIMVVARSAAQNLSFYGSGDLKSWQFLSDFGPAGARNEIWECPGLAKVPVMGGGNQKKWLLHVGGGTNKVQYWVGNFDGTRFTMDEDTRAFLEDGRGLEGDVFADFERDNFWDAGWTYTGSAFGNEPSPRWWNQPAKGHLGQRMASSYVDGDWRTDSTLTSHDFTINRNCINFLIAGGNHPGQTCINLIVGGNVVRSSTGEDSDVMRWAGWNVEEFKGRQARLQIVDDFGGFWGRIYIDQILFSDILTDHRREHANWVEFGPDFFAPKIVRDYDGLETDVKWLGWIGSWEYEQNRPVPANWGKGAESIFRKLQLVSSPKGYQLSQLPGNEMQALRGAVVNVLPRKVRETVSLTEFHPSTNTYEMEAVFNLNGAGRNFGLNLCRGGTQRVVVGYDASSSQLYLDRRSSGYVSLHPSFPRIVSTPLKTQGDQLKLRIFVDQSSIEVFADDGQRVLTAQIYPDPSGTGVELFSFGGETTLGSLKAWPLASIWR